MAKSTWFTDDEKVLLVQLALGLQQEYLQGKVKAPPTTADIQRRFNRLNSREVSRSTIEKHLAKLRGENRLPRPEATMPTEVRVKPENDLDKPWSLGVSDALGIAPDALTDVLRVWRLCLATNRIFTGRQAKWVARLRHILRDPLNPVNLQHWAYRYAIREQACDVLDLRRDTSDMDAQITMRTWERIIARGRGKVESPHDWQEDLLDVGGNYWKTPAWRLAASGGSIGEVAERDLAAWLGQQGETLLATLPPLNAPLSEDTELVYAHLVTHLSMGRKLYEKTTEEWKEIIQRLRLWVAKPAYQESPPFFQWHDAWPTELLKEVGYEK